MVEGNFIGTNAAGTAAVANGASGVAIFAGASNNTVGGLYDGYAPYAAARNVISGNAVYGVYLSDAGTNVNFVASNFIGTDATGNVAVPNGNAGVIIQAGASSNGLYYNTISANLDEGVLVTGSGTNNNLLFQNQVGTNAAGNAVIADPGESFSSEYGVEVSNGASGTVIYDNVIGGNLIGVYIYGAATGTEVIGNDIGTDATGQDNLGNVYFGVYLYDTSGNVVESNTIDNSLYGLYTYDSDANTIAYNGFAGDVYGNQISYG